MLKTAHGFLVIVFALFFITSTGAAAPDQYAGDCSIYGGTPTAVQPNVLIIVDDSGSMGDTVPGGSYDPSVTYDVVNRCIVGGWPNQPCNTNAVYTSSYNFVNTDVNNITTSCRGANPRLLLQTTGQYSGRRLTSDGTGCRTTGTASYVLGNYVNWRYGPGAPKQKITIARDVVNQLITSTFDVKFGLMRFHYPGGTGSASGAEGSEFLNVSASGVDYVTTVKDMDALHTFTTTTVTNRDALVQAVNTLGPRGYTPLGEALFEAMRYFSGGATAYGNTIGVDGFGNYTSPIDYSCQQNYIIFVTDGMDTASNHASLTTICNNGDCDGDGSEPGDLEHSMDDVAKYLYDNDLLPDAIPGALAGQQRVITYTIGFGLTGANADAIALLTRAADDTHGHGNYYLAGSETELSSAFTDIVSEIFAVNTSFVAPVVPVSPENRTYSGSRVYMGFFKPSSGKFWSGNLKKYGLDDNNNVLSVSSQFATYVTATDQSHDARDGAIVPVGSSNGSFRQSAQSYWSLNNDRGEVDEGGVGEVLLNRATSRNIFTYIPGGNPSLVNAVNSFVSSNITPTMVGLTTTADRDKLVDFIHGIDAYDEDSDGDVTDKRSWILGDVLHSRPLVISYNPYSAATQESNCTVNTTRIFVGANDGMLHAFKDCDGSEEWAFIPPDLLRNLSYLTTSGNAHAYFVDFSPTAYMFDANKNGTIEPSQGDMVILLFGLRRGGGLDSSPTKGYYYAINVTDPSNPVFLWSISNTEKVIGGNTSTPTTEFAELAEAWSDITTGKIKVGGVKKAVAFIGGGYDNCNEDARYGLATTYPGACVSIPTGESGATTSALGFAPVGPKGRALYVVEIAEFNAGNIPQLTATSGNTVKVFSGVAGMDYSFPSRVKAVDKDYDNFIDILYSGDAGGNMWRFDISSPAPASWTAHRIFSVNPGYSASSGATAPALEAPASTGRKVFYEPSVVIESDNVRRLYFGSGDREHPMNTALVDRLYCVLDRGQTTADDIKESRLADVTVDDLQDLNASDVLTGNIVTALTSSTNFGWYIRLDEMAGEKALAPATVYNQLAIFTTYSPVSTITSTDMCSTGNLGTATVYVVDYLTGAAVINYDTTNDTLTGSNIWARPSYASYNLLRSDRKKTLGGGIPSGAVPVVSSTGVTSLMIGQGGSINEVKTKGGRVAMPIYWRQKGEQR